MKGTSQFRWSAPLLVALGVACLPGTLPAQTAEELAQRQEIRQRELEHVRQEIAEERARLEHELQQIQQAHQHELAQVREAMAQAHTQDAEARAQYERARELYAKAMEAGKAGYLALDPEVAAHYQHARQLHAEALAVDQEQTLERQERLRQVEERLREIRERVRDQSVEIESRTRRALERAEQEARRTQEILIRMQSRVRLGVELDGNQGEEFDSQGVRIQGIIEGSPAEAIGLRESDIITHVNGQSLLSPIPQEDEQEFDLDSSVPVQRLQALVQELEPGDQAEIRYLRDGEAHDATFEAADVETPSMRIFNWAEGPGVRGVYRIGPDSVMAWNFSEPDSAFVWHFSDPEREFFYNIPKLQELRELGELKELEELGELRLRLPELELEELEGNILRGFSWDEGEGRRIFTVRRGADRYGLEMAELNPGLGEYFATDEGVLVLDVEEDSGLGLRAGDVILSIDGRAVEDQADVRRILGSYEEAEAVTFRIMRSGQETEVRGNVG